MRQSSRLILTLVFLVLLFVLTRFITGQWFYLPSGDKNIWFQAGLLMVVLGSFFIEKHFTKPVDVVTNVVAAVITLLSLEHRENFLFWGTTFVFILAIGVGAFLSMVIQTFSHSSRLLKLGRVLFELTTFIGSAKRLFSGVLFLSVISYFELPSIAGLSVFLFWAVVVTSEPLGIPGFIERLIDSIIRGDAIIGRVWRIIGVNIYQIELSAAVKKNDEKLLEVTQGTETFLCIPLKTFTLKDKKILNAIAISNQTTPELSPINDPGTVKVIDIAQIPESIKGTKIFTERKKLLGIVEDNSDIEQLKFKLLSDQSLQEGYLVKVFIGGEPIVYQIVNAITHSNSYEGDEDRFVLVVAQQVGRWDNRTSRFESIGWVADPGSPVFYETGVPVSELDVIGETKKVVGKLPNSGYPIYVEINDVVTHHTAILGITGSGKTFLAFELIRKMVASGIKVLIFDISADYARDLNDLNPQILTTTGAIAPFLNNAEHKIAIAEFQPTSSETIVKATAISVRHVLDWAKHNLTSQQGENIKAKICV